MKRESDLRIFVVALSLAVVCSVVVSVTAVMLQPIQAKNATINRNRNVLIACGEYNPKVSIKEAFKNIRAGFVKLGTAEFVESDDLSDFYRNFQQISTSPKTSVNVPDDLPSIGYPTVPKHMPAYILQDENGQISKVVIMVYGKGLWSTLYGFLSVKSDGRTVQGLTFYQHGETPGLGGKVDNKEWKQQWNGKKLYGKSGNVRISVIKGNVDATAENAKYKVDGLSGATMTTNGVDNLIKFWVSDFAYGTFLKSLSESGGSK
ncbi:NADH:ubiquinone oxidoreductase, subunit C [Flexistipes sinusarabici DSM 4947]|uniref:Na(+)-translocating NADH-quinone reductase subunit C n=1 Tax=Flexistipes sinusarabici (strain ATCC 49648 / DSM 4947 / MAS 10) TaxID=717231 RepID=F8E4B0_FLESM|nr:Na(+)-translocating NADH-quinone reductase subunit C [Flexistipes sinusarabici]AEI15537.1 NADH:ubiquinone oxidoreductase, subunit C [Flexistipes sinusarabici DSM 4947]